MKKHFHILMVLFLALGLGFGLGGSRAFAQDSPPQPEIKLATTTDLPIQGRLLTASGVPVNGVVNVSFRLYSAASGGSLYCEDLHAVTVTNGLYATTLHCPRQILDGRDLYLAVKLEGDDEMTPRQKILPVAYAASFLPGAFVNESTGTGPALVLAGSNPGLPGTFYVINGDAAGIAGWFDNSSSTVSPLVVRNLGEGPLFVAMSGNDESADFTIRNFGAIETNADSQFTVPASGLHVSGTCANLAYLDDGSVRLSAVGSPCTFAALLSMETPLQLYGTPVTVEYFTFYMYTNSSSAYIDSLQIYLQNPSGIVPITMATSDGNYGTPGFYVNYSIAPTSHATLSGGVGPITIKFNCVLGTGTYIELRSVRVSLSHRAVIP